MIDPKLALAACLVAVAPAPATAQELPRDVFARNPADEIQDVLFAGEGRPMLVRFHIQVDGQGFRAPRFALALKLHREGDVDGNGVLDRKEAAAVADRIRAMQAPPGMFPQARPPRSINNPPGDVSVEDLALLLTLQAGGFGFPPQAQAPRTTAQDDPTLAGLDLDGDGVLSREEMERVPAWLARLDLNDDEALSAEELAPYRNPFTNRVVNVRGTIPPSSQPISPVADAFDANTVARLLDRYRDRRVGPALIRGELAIDRAAFDRLDDNHDERVDPLELERAFLAGADVELIVRLGRRDPGEPAIERVAAHGPPPFGEPTVRVTGEGAVILQVGGDTIEIQAGGRNPAIDSYESAYRAQFRAADRNADKVLEAVEVAANNFLKNILGLADLDRDGRLTESELSLFLDRQAEVAGMRPTLAASERGRSLLDILDVDRDQRVGARELREAPRQLLREDRDGDGRVALKEIPRHHRWSIAPGPPTGGPVLLPGGNLAVTRTVATAPPDRRPPKAPPPAWFGKMDRNRDGDLSPREFLGPRSAFDRLDADSDGLIGSGEATTPP